ncbi:hypothetical protein KEJ36_00485 [Candidatus Bathyarchaeota archaeon]|nr:hypothetical protein [Candidatus Bathyarchaeota archaeon]MBS7627300.1 hypothetical protein [Candidatus Bathyarchaeota archaeon]
MGTWMGKGELMELADDVAGIARRWLGYDYAGVLIRQSAQRFPEEGMLQRSQALNVLFLIYDSYAEGLDPLGRESLLVLKIYVLLEVARRRPEYLSNTRKLAIHARLAYHKAKGFWRIHGRRRKNP